MPTGLRVLLACSWMDRKNDLPAASVTFLRAAVVLSPGQLPFNSCRRREHALGQAQPQPDVAARRS